MDYGRQCYDRYRSGDDSALVELMDMFADGLTLYLNSIVHDISLAEELTEEAFFRISATNLIRRISCFLLTGIVFLLIFQ